MRSEFVLNGKKPLTYGHKEMLTGLADLDMEVAYA
jgi:hypothetical protein